jgi:tetratricopeptide (TPR) repeat protein
VIWREGRILGEDGGISLNRPDEAATRFQTAYDMAEQLSRRDPADYISRMRLTAAALDLGNILRHSDPARALAVYDYGRQRSMEVKNVQATRDQVRLLAGSSYALRKLHRVSEARQRIDAAFELLAQMKAYPSAQINLGDEADVALRSLGDHFDDTGEYAQARRTYEELLRKAMASQPMPETDLRHANDLSYLWQRLAALKRKTGDIAGAEELDRSRRELWEKWNRKLPDNSFVKGQLSTASSA